MSTGYIDPDSGIYIYGPDDPRQPMHDVLNLAQTATRDAVVGMQGDIASLEQTTPVPGELPAPLNGYALDAGSIMMRVGGLVFMSLVLTKSAGVDAVIVAQLPTGYRPPSTITVQGVASQGGLDAVPLILTIAPSGDIRCWTAAAGRVRLDLSTSWLATG